MSIHDRVDCTIECVFAPMSLGISLSLSCVATQYIDHTQTHTSFSFSLAQCLCVSCTVELVFWLSFFVCSFFCVLLQMTLVIFLWKMTLNPASWHSNVIKMFLFWHTVHVVQSVTFLIHIGLASDWCQMKGDMLAFPTVVSQDKNPISLQSCASHKDVLSFFSACFCGWSCSSNHLGCETNNLS